MYSKGKNLAQLVLRVKMTYTDNTLTLYRGHCGIFWDKKGQKIKGHYGIVWAKKGQKTKISKTCLVVNLKKIRTLPEAHQT